MNRNYATFITMEIDNVYEKVFLNVSIIDFLRHGTELLCIDYDFDSYDKNMILTLAAMPEPANRTFIWLCRNHGTNFCSEREAFINNTHSHKTLLACVTPFVCAYALLVEITGEQDGQPIGNIYKLNLAEYVQEIHAKVIWQKEHKSTYEDGYSMILPLGTSIGWLRDHGHLITDEPIPESEAALAQILRGHKVRRQSCVKKATKEDQTHG